MLNKYNVTETREFLPRGPVYLTDRNFKTQKYKIAALVQKYIYKKFIVTEHEGKCL